MAIYIKEYVGGLSASNISSYKRKSSKNLKESTSSGCSVKIKKGSLMQNIEGIHVGGTRNYTWYTESALLSSESSWTRPYLKPLIMHHNETDGKIIGRIHDANYATTDTRSGSPAIKFLCNIPDKDGIEQVQDGRLNTVSIGIIAHDVRCSICEEQIELDEDGESECGHVRGDEYDGKTCYWVIYSMEAKELSYVIVPSDIYAHNLDGWIVGEKDEKLKLIESNNDEGGNDKVKRKDIKEALLSGKIIETQEGVSIDTDGNAANVKEKSNLENEDDNKEGEDNGEVQDEEDSKKEGTEEGEVLEEKNNEECDKLKEECEKLKEENTKLKEGAEKIESTFVDLKKIITVAQETISELTKEVAEKDTLIEAAEDEALAVKGELRDYLESDLESFQKIAGEEVTEKAAVAIETKESIICKITSLKEKLNSKKAKVEITEAKDDTLKRDHQFKEKIVEDVNKENKNSNVSLEEAMSDLFGKF